MPARISKTLLWLVLPDKICLMSTSHLYRSILCQVKARSNDFQRRIDLNSNILITASQGQRLFHRILSNSTYMQQYSVSVFVLVGGIQELLKRKVFVWLNKLQKNKQRISLDLELSKKAQVSTQYRRRNQQCVTGQPSFKCNKLQC